MSPSGSSVELSQAPLTSAGPEILTVHPHELCSQLAGRLWQGGQDDLPHVPGNQWVINYGEVGGWATDHLPSKLAQASPARQDFERAEVHRAFLAGTLSLPLHFIGKSKLQGQLGSKEIDPTSWWEELQSHIAKGVESGRMKL